MSKITVFTARKVITMDSGRPAAEAVAVMDGKVVSTGSLKSMQPWLSRHEHTIDHTLKDKVVMPGLIDPHTHFTMSAGYLVLHYIGPIESPGPKGMNPALLTHEEVVAKLRSAHAEESDPKNRSSPGASTPPSRAATCIATNWMRSARTARCG